jgi:hypothetical protein
MKQHNFISGEYLKTIEKRERKFYLPITLLLILLNVLVLQEKEQKMADIETARSKAVFSNIQNEDSPKISQSINIFDLRRKVYSLAEDSISISSFLYENNKIILQISAQSPKLCINFLKQIEEKGEFTIKKLSPIETVQQNYKLTIDLLVKGAEQRK